MKPWPLRPLEEIAELYGGSTPSRENPAFWGGDIPWVTPTDLPMPDEGISVVSKTKAHITQAGLDNSSATVIPKGTVLFSSRATIGKVGVADMPLTTNQGFANFVPHPNVTSRFLAYALWVHREDIARLSGSTTFKEVSKSTLRKYQLPVPTLAEQERIVNLLDKTDELRKLRSQADRLNASLIPALFHEMFGDPTQLERMNWPLTPLGAFADVSYGLPDRLDASTKPENGTRILTISNVLLSGSIDTKVQKFSIVEPAKRGKARIQGYDLLFNWRNGSEEHVGKTAIWEEQLEGEILHVSFLLKIRVDRTKANPYFLWVLLNRLRGTGYFTRNARMQINRKFNASELTALRLPLPPPPLQDEFAKRVTEIRELEAKQASSRERLDALFQSMLHRAFRGEL
jgi:type I restriction enzyme S subunit